MTLHPDTERARVRAQVASAGQIVAATWPIKTFVAVNPLGGHEHLPFEEAITSVGDILGLRGHLPIAEYRSRHAKGRITDADLDAALIRRLPDLSMSGPVRLGSGPRSALEVLRTDLLAGPVPSPSPRRPRGAGEWCDLLLGTSVAPHVDDQVSKWCSAFSDTRRARWPMPGRARGLYRAWRRLVPSDPALRRLDLPVGHFRSLPARPEDALLDALTTLGVADTARRTEMRAQLARRPGWASHIKWRSEHPDQAPHPADLVDLLALRLSYEAPLVDRAASAALPQGTADLQRHITETLTARDTTHPTDHLAVQARARAVAAALGCAAVSPSELADLTEILTRLPAHDRGWVWQDAYEWHYRDRLLTLLDRPVVVNDPGRPAAQAVFCIDARSEGLRRHLHAQGQYQTFGFAGFYQLVIRYQTLAGAHTARLCPVPLTPTKTITEYPAAGTEQAAAEAIATERHADALVSAFHGAKDNLASPFALAEAAGWVAGPLAAVKTAAPTRFTRWRGRLGQRTHRTSNLTVDTPLAPEQLEAFVAQAERQSIRAALHRADLSDEACEQRRRRCLAGSDPELAATLDLTPAGHQERLRGARRLGYAPEEQVFWAEFALRSFGLVDGFAPIVLLVGHGSRTENNAYEAALDCGACGGQPGEVNARIAAALLNRPAVRGGLAERGISIPEDTIFVAAVHDTATDSVTILDQHLVNGSHRDEAHQLQTDLAAAGAALAQERARRLPGGDHPDRRSGDWAQVRPEWGLARHAAFVVGPGDLVSGLDLQTRTFLHSYDWQVDPDARALETILTAPGLVIQWINAQYYFSSVDPDVLGAGDKTLHNVVGDIGVLQGYSGDLRLGLPWQSIAVGGTLFHEPMRALYVVQAPRETVEMLIQRNSLLQHYFDGAWLSLVVREGPGDPWQWRTPSGEWVAWTPATASTATTTPTKYVEVPA